jgi:protein-L-isoaspartate(D-aspartate) O-methyltransferase
MVGQPLGALGSRWLPLVATIVISGACNNKGEPARRAPEAPETRAEQEKPANTAVDSNREKQRMSMVAEQIEARGVRDERVLAAMRRVPRHEFVPDEVQRYAYDDRPLPIGDDQTISQPYVVAAMTELARVGPGKKVLEVGTGSGYQAAVLAEVGAEVYSIEIVDTLAARAKTTLRRLGYDDQQIHLRTGDGYAGWPDAAPFDAIVVTAAPPRIPKPLEDQLAVGGRLVIPVGSAYQELKVITRTEAGYDAQSVFPVRFVPMTGKAQEP